MDVLRARVLEAHGGLANLERLTSLTAKLSLRGPCWTARGWHDMSAGHAVTRHPPRRGPDPVAWLPRSRSLSSER
jgi:hypothetical protein